MSERDILFRGKSIRNGCWLFGDLIHHDDECQIDTSSFVQSCGSVALDDEFAIPETVGAYTGLTDKNGTRIFEGDILSGVYSNSNAVVEMIAGCWVGYAGKGWTVLGYLENKIEVIGNIHDNPELLKGE